MHIGENGMAAPALQVSLMQRQPKQRAEGAVKYSSVRCKHDLAVQPEPVLAKNPATPSQRHGQDLLANVQVRAGSQRSDLAQATALWRDDGHATCTGARQLHDRCEQTSQQNVQINPRRKASSQLLVNIDGVHLDH